MSQEQEFINLLEQYKRLIFKIANAYGRTEEDLKDLVQEIILQLWKAYPKYDPKFALSTWVYRIALNVSISFYRKEKTRKKTYSGYKQDLELIAWPAEPMDERLQKLYAFIEQLKPLDKAIIILHLEGQGNKEIAKIMGISPSNVSTRINRIKNKLANNFAATKS